MYSSPFGLPPIRNGPLLFLNLARAQSNRCAPGASETPERSDGNAKPRSLLRGFTSVSPTGSRARVPSYFSTTRGWQVGEHCRLPMGPASQDSPCFLSTLKSPQRGASVQSALHEPYS